jgi:hypothetical protein
MAQPFTLDVIQVAKPCHAAWDKMAGDARVRHCGDCHKNVYNLSEMTRADAEALLQKHEGRLCVRYYVRADGTMLTADCPVGLLAAAHRRLAGWFAAIAASLLTVAAFGNMLARGGASRSTQVFGNPAAVTTSKMFVPTTVMMGDVCPVPQIPAPIQPPVITPSLDTSNPDAPATPAVQELR